MTIVQQIVQAYEEMKFTSFHGSRQDATTWLRQWEKPDEKTINLICNVTQCQTSRRDGLRIIARNHVGHICGGRQLQVSADSIEELEAKAILEGVKLAIQNRWKHVSVESDAEMVINHFKGTKYSWRIDTIVDNAKVIARLFESANWVNILKSAYQCADWLAKQVMQGLCPLN